MKNSKINRKTNKEIKEIISEHEKVINLLGKNNETIMTILDMSILFHFMKMISQKLKKYYFN